MEGRRWPGSIVASLDPAAEGGRDLKVRGYH